MESAGRWTKLSVWFALGLATLAIVFPELGITQPQTEMQSAVPAASVVLQIDGMDCRGCAAGLEARLAASKGIRRAKVLFDDSKGVVQYDPEIIQPEQIVAIVDENGFTAMVEKE